MASRTKSPTSVGIHVGNAAEAMSEMRKCIMDILQADVENATMQKALDVLGNVSRIHDISINGCSVTMGEK